MTAFSCYCLQKPVFCCGRGVLDLQYCVFASPVPGFQPLFQQSQFGQNPHEKGHILGLLPWVLPGSFRVTLSRAVKKLTAFLSCKTLFVAGKIQATGPWNPQAMLKQATSQWVVRLTAVNSGKWASRSSKTLAWACAFPCLSMTANLPISNKIQMFSVVTTKSVARLDTRRFSVVIWKIKNPVSFLMCPAFVFQ